MFTTLFPKKLRYAQTRRGDAYNTYSETNAILNAEEIANTHFAFCNTHLRTLLLLRLRTYDV